MNVLKIGKEKLYFTLGRHEISCFFNFCPVWKMSVETYQVFVILMEPGVVKSIISLKA